MSILFRAEDEPPRSRFEYWRHVVRDTYSVPFDLRIDDGPDFRSQIRAGDLGAVRISEVVAPSSEIFRTPELVRRSDPELYLINVQVSGRTVAEQDGRQAVRGPGDFSIVDLSRPSHLAGPPHQVVAVMFPRAMLPLRQEQVARFTGTRFPGDRGADALVSSCARQLVRHIGECRGSTGARLGVVFVDLLAAALAARLDRRPQVPPDSARRALLLRVHAFIEQHLADPELSPGTIAAAHHISVRYLYKLFEASGATVGGWIRQRRLDHCRRDLLNPALRARPVRAIGARWGFPDQPSFGRAFRRSYGIPPGEYRSMHNGHPGAGT